MRTTDALRKHLCLACWLSRPTVVHAYWTTVCTHAMARRPWRAHEMHLCSHCARELCAGRDPRVTLQFGRRLRHLAPIANVRMILRRPTLWQRIEPPLWPLGIFLLVGGPWFVLALRTWLRW